MLTGSAAGPGSTWRPRLEAPTSSRSDLSIRTHTGEYAVVLSSVGPREDDHGFSFDTATFVAPGVTPGFIINPADKDFFVFEAQGGTEYTIEVRLGTHPDTVLELYDAAGNFLDENDDAEGLGGGSRLRLTPSFAGHYFLVVRSYDDAEGSGSYVLAVQPAVEAAPTPTSTPVPVPPNLVPFAPEGWEAPLSVSEGPSSFVDLAPPGGGPFEAGKEVFIHWAVKNVSPTVIEQQFHVAISVDGQVVDTFPVPGLGDQEIERRLSVPLVLHTPGAHTVQVTVDFLSQVAESSEGDNIFSTIIFVLASQPTPTPTPAPAAASGGRIAFVSDRDGNQEIYAMNANGSSQTRLTNDTATDNWPSWSPDGAKIAFYSVRDGDSEIYVMNADGSSPTKLTLNTVGDWDPAWSPNGTQIVFSSHLDGIEQIYVMNANGTGQTKLTTGAINWRAVWSPDGLRIAFVSYRDGDEEIYVMNADGSNPVRLTNNIAGDSKPSWSPDGARIAFHSDRDGNDEIYVMNIDGSGVTRLTNNPALDSQPSWSPDGSKIAFHTNRDGKVEIYVMNSDGSGQTNLTNNPAANDSSPSWGP